MTEHPTTFRDRMHALVTPPAVGDERRWLSAWVHIWRTLLLTVTASAAIGVGWLLVAGLLVAAPHAIVTGTLDENCVSDGRLDCFRAIADARQAVLFSVGGVIALVGIMFTYLRWRDDNTLAGEALEEGRRSAGRYAREHNQNRLDRITGALGLLESSVPAKRFAAVSLLTDYALQADEQEEDEDNYARTILGVLEAYVRERDYDSYKRPNFPRTDQKMSVDEVDNLAIVNALRIAATRGLHVDFSGLTFVDLRGEATDWENVNTKNMTFIRGTLAGARFGRNAEPRIGMRFFNTNLDETDFSGSKLTDTYFGPEETTAGHGQYLPGALDFTDADLVKVEFRNTNLVVSKFAGSNLQEVDTPGSVLPLDSFTPVTLHDCDFSDSAAFWFIDLRLTHIVATSFGDSRTHVDLNDDAETIDGLVYSDMRDEGYPPDGHAEALERRGWDA